VRTSSYEAGIAQLVERQPSKLGVAGSSPVSRSVHAALERNFRPSNLRFRRDPHRFSEGPRGSAVERFLGKEEVTGSIPVVGSIISSFFGPKQTSQGSSLLKTSEENDGEGKI
jgi:hypothetical protein